MPIAGVRLGGGPEYQLPSQATLVLAKAAVMALVSSPLTMMPRFAAFEGLVAGAAADAAGVPAGTAAVAEVAAGSTVGPVLEVGTTAGAVSTV